MRLNAWNRPVSVRRGRAARCRHRRRQGKGPRHRQRGEGPRRRCRRAERRRADGRARAAMQLKRRRAEKHTARRGGGEQSQTIAGTSGEGHTPRGTAAAAQRRQPRSTRPLAGCACDRGGRCGRQCQRPSSLPPFSSKNATSPPGHVQRSAAPPRRAMRRQHPQLQRRCPLSRQPRRDLHSGSIPSRTITTPARRGMPLPPSHASPRAARA